LIHILVLELNKYVGYCLGWMLSLSLQSQSIYSVKVYLDDVVILVLLLNESIVSLKGLFIYKLKDVSTLNVTVIKVSLELCDFLLTLIRFKDSSDLTKVLVAIGTGSK
jgi:hypothetical protein